MIGPELAATVGSMDPALLALISAVVTGPVAGLAGMIFGRRKADAEADHTAAETSATLVGTTLAALTQLREQALSDQKLLRAELVEVRLEADRLRVEASELREESQRLRVEAELLRAQVCELQGEIRRLKADRAA
jgi:hypothetical protein